MMRPMPRAIAVIAAAGLLLPAAPAFAQTIKYEPMAGVQTFAVREPVLRIKPGATVETRTFTRPGDYYDPTTAGPWPGEVGPFHIEGAEPGDQLVVRVLRLRPNQDVAISNVTPGGITAWPPTAAPACSTIRCRRAGSCGGSIAPATSG